MFTGLVEEVGTIKGIKRSGDSMILEINANKILNDVTLGDSIAVNGICLTVTSFNNNTFSADVMPETVYKTSLKDLEYGRKVNLERAMSANSRFGGHIVSGHIDGTAKLISKRALDNAVYFTFKLESSLASKLLPKGSIAIEGISLTLVNVEMESFSVSIIPHTLAQTSLADKKIGEVVNIELDLVGKYIQKAVENIIEQKIDKESTITESFLSENGFA